MIFIAEDKNTTFSFISDFWKSSEFDVEYLNVTRKENYYPCCVEPYPRCDILLQVEPTGQPLQLPNIDAGTGGHHLKHYRFLVADPLNDTLRIEWIQSTDSHITFATFGHSIGIQFVGRSRRRSVIRYVWALIINNQ